jgi:drug/metabolite transporter (DMT)-like permease
VTGAEAVPAVNGRRLAIPAARAQEGLVTDRTMPTLLWIPATLIAAAAQTGRNALQRRLTETLGTLGATQVRFLYGLPFALIFLAVVLAVTGAPMPRPTPRFLGFVLVGAAAQVAATALMLAAMRARSFAVVTALIKTEPVQIAVFGFAVLGDRLPPAAVAAIVVATLGVILASFRGGVGDLSRQGSRPVVLGLLAGGAFAVSAVGFRGAILDLQVSPLVGATTALAWGLAVQTTLLLAWMLVFSRGVLVAILRAWRTSLAAGFLGAFASQFWFLGFALTAAANVRTLALVEVLMAQAVSHRFLAQRATRRELAGLALIVLGVGLLVARQA